MEAEESQELFPSLSTPPILPLSVITTLHSVFFLLHRLPFPLWEIIRALEGGRGVKRTPMASGRTEYFEHDCSSVQRVNLLLRPNRSPELGFCSQLRSLWRSLTAVKGLAGYCSVTRGGINGLCDQDLQTTAIPFTPTMSLANSYTLTMPLPHLIPAFWPTWLDFPPLRPLYYLLPKPPPKIEFSFGAQLVLLVIIINDCTVCCAATVWFDL